MGNFNFIPTALEGVTVVEARRFEDPRGFFTESYTERDFAAAGIGVRFVQDNHSLSRRGVLRGLHFQHPRVQGKLVRVVTGSVLDVAVDIRPASPTFRRWVAVELSAANGRQLYIPGGFAHGFLALEDGTNLVYKCTDYYDPASDGGIAWDDPATGVDWGLEKYGLERAQLVISDKDRALPRLGEIEGLFSIL